MQLDIKLRIPLRVGVIHMQFFIDWRFLLQDVILPAYCEWTDFIFVEIVGKVITPVFQIDFYCITPV